MFGFLLKLSVRSIIYAVEASYNTPERKGARGERKVHNALSSVLDSNEYQVFSDVILPTVSGTTQLDHIVLSNYGIFIIETKNMSGWIFGGANQRKWTQVQKGGKRRSFQNPLRQNYAHVKAVEEILGVDGSVLQNFVVFTGSAQPKTEMPGNVAWGLRALGKLIGQQREMLLSPQETHAFAQKIQSKSLESTEATRAQHVQNLQSTSASRTVSVSQVSSQLTSQKSCPKCSGEMVERKNKKTGETFWGCAKFPKCRGTRKMM